MKKSKETLKERYSRLKKEAEKAFKEQNEEASTINKNIKKEAPRDVQNIP